MTLIKTSKGRAVLAAAVVGALSAGAVGAAESLTVVSWGGAYSESQREAFVKPFAAATGTTMTEEDYNGEVSKIRAMVETNSVVWDVVDVDSQTALAGCAEGIFETIDWNKLGLDRSKFIGAEKFDCAIPNILYSTIIAYDADKLNPGPTTIHDLFDLEKFPGKRALWKSPNANLEWALIADGVPADKVYEVLATPEGVDRAFKKLDTIESSIVWWEAGAQPPGLLGSGEAVIVSAWNGRIYNAMLKEGKNFKIVWDHQIPDWDLWAIPKGSPRLDTAYKFLSFASQPAAMAEQTKYISYGPSNRDAVPNIDPKVLPHLPTAPENMTTALSLDVVFWADHLEELRERFNAWLAQ